MSPVGCLSLGSSVSHDTSHAWACIHFCTFYTFTDTTDVQTVEAVFFENQLFLRCSFAGNSQARGCIVRLTLSSTNETESFEVSRESGFLCTTANNQRDAYSTMVVLDFEANGMEGNVSLNINSSVLTSQEEYTQVTGCREGKFSLGMSLKATLCTIDTLHL